VFVREAPSGGAPSTASAVLNEQGQVVRVTFGPAPLWGAPGGFNTHPRRDQDVMMTDVLGFDLRVYDPGAPLFGRRVVPGNTTTPLTVLQPSDPGWRFAYDLDPAVANQFEFLGQGAYVDLGYGNAVPATKPVVGPGNWTRPWFAEARGLIDIYYDTRTPPPAPDKQFSLLAPGYAVYDTWSFHYENNGVNEDELRSDGSSWQVVDTKPDEGTNGFDDPNLNNAVVNGPDDVGEYETTPPYDKPLRGVQLLIRTYEPDSRAIRQVRVNQHFLPE
jgi:hypothetical protein